MAVRFKDQRTDGLSGEKLHSDTAPGLADRLAALSKECAALPDYDTRSPEEIVGYDEQGMW
jgi:antitoxin VapB